MMFDVESYLGKWYQIASVPQPYAYGCIFSTANYWKEDDKIKVRNCCYDVQGDLIRDIEGTILPSDAEGEFCVSFKGMRKNNQVNYIVLDTDYESYAVVGGPNTLYVLSRSPEMCNVCYEALTTIAGKYCYDTKSLRRDL